MTGSAWSYMLFEAGERVSNTFNDNFVNFKFNCIFVGMLYFHSFHLLSIMILASLFKGIIWEIFSVVDSEQDKLINEALEIEQEEEIQDEKSESKDEMKKKKNQVKQSYRFIFL